MIKMSSISAQGVVERASAELSKRINGLGLRKHHHGHSGKTSVMERVTNVLCGGSSSASHNSINAPEKPSRLQTGNKQSQQMGNTKNSANIGGIGGGGGGGSGSLQNTPQAIRKSQHQMLPHQQHPGQSTSQQPPPILTIDELFMDENFLNMFFLYFSSIERCTLAQVCHRWREILYRNHRYWSGLIPVLPCRELRQMPNHDRVKLYNTIVWRGYHCMCLLGATDEDALDIIHQFKLASKNIHSISLRCSSISDRGLETLLDHLQSLFELELIGCNEITEAGLWSCLTPRIVSLTLSDCINIADEAVGAVAQLLPSLYEFSLQAYHVTDAALGYFSPKQSQNLSILRLSSCWELTNHGIVNIVHSLPHLSVLSLSGCSKVTDDGVELIAENLQKLRALDLSWCPRITDAALEYIACDLNQLEELTLDRCVHITDIGVGYISTMLSLSALFLRWCSQIRDFGLQHLCSMRNLQILSLAGCPLLTSSGLSSLIQLRHLQELELTNCPGASQELFEYLHEHLPKCLVIE